MSLPYTDTKPQGAPDFYLAINATFAFLLRRLGHEAWVGYLRAMAKEYFRPVNDTWRRGGLPAIADYWREFFAAEPGAAVSVTHSADRVQIDVRVCPAIHHLRTSGRGIVREYCQHCYYLGEARAAAAGFAMRLEGGNGSCRHTYFTGKPVAPQDLAAIKEAH